MEAMFSSLMDSSQKDKGRLFIVNAMGLKINAWGSDL